MKSKKLSWILLLSIVLAVTTSCLKNEICSPVDIELKAGIYTIVEFTGTIDTVLTKIDIDTIYGITTEDNNLLLDATQIDKINFPLNDATNESSFVISIGGSKDTIHFDYAKHLIFNSVKCGVYYTYTINTITFSTNFLQNIILINPEIDVVSAENIQLVY